MAGEHQGPPPGDAWAPAIVEGSLFSPLGPGSGGLGVSLEDLERGVRFLDQDGSISGPTGGGGGGRVVSRGGVSDPNGGAGGGEGESFPVLLLGIVFVVLFAMVNETLLSLVAEVYSAPGFHGETRRS